MKRVSASVLGSISWPLLLRAALQSPGRSLLVLAAAGLLTASGAVAAAVPFGEQPINDVFAGANSVYAADVDGDGDLDVLGTAIFADDITWFENTVGDGSAWTAHTIEGDFDLPRSVYAADLDSDGDLDVLGAASGTDDDIAWFENTAGDGSTWTEHTIEGDFDSAAAVYATDVDGDGDTDVLGAALGADDLT